MVPLTIQRLIEELNKLPGIGPKSAERLVFYLLTRTDEENTLLGNALLSLKENISLCPLCFNFSDEKGCTICHDTQRDHSLLCVIETIPDLVAIERVGEYRGLYHVLQGKIDPLRQKGPESIKLRELKERIVSDKRIKEIIIATSPDIEGETTAMYISRMIPHTKIKITRIARGIPSGGNIEFADDMTLRNALKGRTEY